jgi:tetratricopeptide (TPR) repeat protein
MEFGMRILYLILILSLFTPLVSPAQATASDDEKIAMLLELGGIYLKENNLEDALRIYKRVLDADPENQDALNLSSLIYVNTHNYKNALETMQQLAELTPEDYQQLNNMAWVYATATDPQYRDAVKAIDLAQQALVMSPYSHHVWSTLSEAYFANGDYERADACIRQVVAVATAQNVKISQEMVDTYNQQIRKCNRARETQELLDQVQ